MEKNNAMRKHDPKHEIRLNALTSLKPDQIKHQLLIDDYLHPDYVASEVLASLVRIRYGLQNGLLELITRTLHKRVIIGIQGCINKNQTLRSLVVSNGELIKDATSYFWEKFLGDEQAVSNAEVRFGVYLTNRVIDYMRHLLTNKNSSESIDGFTSIDDEDSTSNFIDTVSDEFEESPEMIVIRNQTKSELNTALMKLTKNERAVFSYRSEYEYDWKQIAQFMDCSIPTAQKLFKASKEKLLGVLK